MGFDLQEIKRLLPLAEVLRTEGYELKRMGRRLRCLSPFNVEKSPSCFVDPDTNRFKCFSSDQSGDLFDYLMLINGWSKSQAIEYAAQRCGVSKSNSAPIPKARPSPKAALPDSKLIVQISGRDLQVWQEGVEVLSTDVRMAAGIGSWRGFSPSSVLALARAGAIGCILLPDFLRRQDQEPGERRVAFPVTIPAGALPAFSAGGQVAYHVRLKPRPGEKKASWRFVPSGVGAWPYVLGDFFSARLAVICEGQWDAMAFYDAAFSDENDAVAALAAEKLAIIGIRGAANWRLFVEHYLLADRGGERCGETVVRPDLDVLLICDSDIAGEGWTTAEDDKPCLFQILNAVCRKVYVREPREGFGKDLNDVWRKANETRIH